MTALAGTSLLAYDGSSVDINIGDAWSIAAAAASAMFILRLEAASVNVPNSAALNAACLWVVSLSALLWTVGAGVSSGQAPDEMYNQVLHVATAHPWEVLYLGGVTTALANYMQTKAQQQVTAERASVIYAMDPVYGAAWSNVLLGETLGPTGLIGAGLITLAAATNAFLDLGAKESSSTESSVTNGTTK